MPIELNIDPLSLELHEKELSIPVHALRREMGTVRVTLREFPYAVARATEIQGAASFGELGKATAALTRMQAGEVLSAEDCLITGQALALQHARHVELIRWGIVGHRAEDFTLKGVSIPFESVEKRLAGEVYRVASPRMIALYQAASKDTTHGLFMLIARAVQDFQEGRYRTPDEIWDESSKDEGEPAASTPPAQTEASA